ncbi:MAG: hypothetical protein ABS87_00305 [Sphingomonas sp. SCN 67-18]|uniref:RidA family protein n=1 Tax=uncultured Sphingomonas sp. TaxID=158754 RepID=UPI00086C45CC|nr:RidA family protein [Sphingomonas sp. SCN 67-18]ODU22878.1 MAG: hypothetical protein ABS87_00305 [Sphingomonas sp. SCN 67-18]
MDPAHLPHLDPALPFSAAVTAGGLVLLSGEIGVDAQGRLPDLLEDQAALLFANIERTLSRLGLDRSAIVKCTVMLADMADWDQFNRVYSRFFEGLPAPARSAFGCSGLALGAKVEMECIAVTR